MIGKSHFKWVKDLPNGGSVYRDGEKIGEFGYLAFGWQFTSVDGKRHGWRHLQLDLKKAVVDAYEKGRKDDNSF